MQVSSFFGMHCSIFGRCFKITTRRDSTVFRSEICSPEVDCSTLDLFSSSIRTSGNSFQYEKVKFEKTLECDSFTFLEEVSTTETTLFGGSSDSCSG